MKCFKCGKEMGWQDNQETSRGISVTIKSDNLTPETIAYNNEQLGKYSDGKGGCDVAICYECYIDGLFYKVGAG